MPDDAPIPPAKLLQAVCPRCASVLSCAHPYAVAAAWRCCVCRCAFYVKRKKA